MSAFAGRAQRRQVAQRVARKLGSVEKAYTRGIANIARAYTQAYAKAIEPHLATLAGQKQDAGPRNLPNELDLLGARVQLAIPRAVSPQFERMSKAVEKSNAEEMTLFGLNPAAGNAELRQQISDARDENIKLVENAHRVYARQVRELVGDPQNFGMRVEDLRDKILERGNVSVSRAELIARDQTLKLNGQITATRQRAAGVTKYTWSTSRDERVRDEHAALEGQTFEWTDPPEPGHPGEDFQCRCVAIPVVDELEDIFSDKPSEETTTSPTPEPPAVAEPEPVEPTLTEGTHAKVIESDAGAETTRELVQSLDEGTLGYLAKAPLDKLKIETQSRIGNVDVNGWYQRSTGRLSVALDRGKLGDGNVGMPFVPGGSYVSGYVQGRGYQRGSWSISTTMPNALEATKADLRHELAHHVHLHDENKKVDQIVQRAFSRARKSEVFLTQYSEKDHKEYFAESYAAYYMRRADLQKHDPNGYRMVRAVLKERKIPT